MPNKKLSRRDAIKLLGAAAGAAALANLPSKWSKPEVISGVLPAHAQSTAACTGNAASFTIFANAGSVMNYEVWFNGPPAITGNLTTGQSYSGNYPCGPGCLEIFALAQIPGPTVELTTFSQGTITIPFTGVGPFTVDILVDLSTGLYSTTRSQTIGSCGWVTV